MSEERETTSANDGTSSAGKGRVDLVGKNPRPRDRLIHSVSIIVEAVHDDGDDPLPVLEEGVDEEKESNDSCCRARQLSPDTELQDEEKGKLSRKQRHQSSPIIFLDDPLTGTFTRSERFLFPCKPLFTRSESPSTFFPSFVSGLRICVCLHLMYIMVVCLFSFQIQSHKESYRQMNRLFSPFL